MKTQKEFFEKFGLIISVASLIVSLLASWDDISRNAIAFANWFGNGAIGFIGFVGLIFVIIAYAFGTLFLGLVGALWGESLSNFIDVAFGENKTTNIRVNGLMLVGFTLGVIAFIANWWIWFMGAIFLSMLFFLIMMGIKKN